MLVVFHVPPATDDPIGALALERRQEMACAGPVRIGEPSYEGDGEPTVTFLLDLVSVLMELAHYVCDRVLPLVEAQRRGADWSGRDKPWRNTMRCPPRKPLWRRPQQ